jgi:hypothetical protein
VLSHNIGDNGSSAVKAPTDGFHAWFGGPVILYGFTRGTAMTGEAAWDPDAPAVFDWFTVRPLGAQYDQDLRGVVQVCVPTPSDQLRVQHEEGPAAVVLPSVFFDVCGTGSLTQLRLSPVKQALAWLHDRLTPAPLQAAVVVATSPSGSVKKFSPVGAVNTGGAVLSFEPFVIPDTKLSEGLGVMVEATGTAGVPWEGLHIKLIAFDNNGSYTLSPDTATTNADGVADFTQSILDKPGGYLLLAITQPGSDIDANGFLPDSVVSGNRFNRLP